MQDAVAAPNTGPTIYICADTYNENIIIERNLTLIGAGSDDGPGNTILDAQQNGRVVTISSGLDVKLQSIRIIGGSVSGGVEDGDGGGIYNVSSILTMTGCVMFQNTADRGGGIFNSDGILTLTECAVLENEAASDGGGIYTEIGEVTLDDSHVTLNTAIQGGGIYSDLGPVTLIGDSSVTLNVPDQCFGVDC